VSFFTIFSPESQHVIKNQKENQGPSRARSRLVYRSSTSWMQDAASRGGLIIKNKAKTASRATFQEPTLPAT